MIWKPLEAEIFRRRNNLNNEQLGNVIYSFGVSGNGNKEFYNIMEEVIIDSEIPIETEYLEKIIFGYTQIDQGTPIFYSHVTEKIIKRGLENVDIVKLSEIAKNLSKATNVHKAGFGFYQELEKHIKKELNEGRVDFQQLA